MEEGSKGFEIVLDDRRHLLWAKAWGRWDLETARTYNSIMRKTLQEIGTDEYVWSGLVDFRNFSPPSKHVLKLVSQQIAYVNQQGMKKISYLGEPSTLQILLHEPECKRQAGVCFESMDEALAWLLTE